MDLNTAFGTYEQNGNHYVWIKFQGNRKRMFQYTVAYKDKATALKIISKLEDAWLYYDLQTRKRFLDEHCVPVNAADVLSNRSLDTLLNLMSDKTDNSHG